MGLGAGGCSQQRLRHVEVQPPALYATEARSDYGMVSSASVEATRAAVEVLEQGGNAVDAAVAGAFALGVSDPGGSGLGGMTYIVIALADGRSVAFDGTAHTPVSVDLAQLAELKAAETPFGYKMAATPTTLATLALALERYGTLDLAQALAPAIEIGESGYRLSQNYLEWTDLYLDQILTSNYLRFVVLDQGLTLGKAGDRYCHPDMVNTLRRIAAEGTDCFYRGAIATQIAADMARNGGFLSRTDLALVRVRECRPLRSSYRDVELLTFPPPGGGDQVVEALNILETRPREFLAEDSVERLHLLIEAYRIAQADQTLQAPRNGGNSFFDPPNLSKIHAKERARLITPGHAIPETTLDPRAVAKPTGEHTVQVSVADRHGNMVSLTQTLGRLFGNKVATPGLGFPYSVFLESFDYEDPTSSAFLRAKSPCRSDMAPTIVLQDGVPVLALGSAGSNLIPTIVTEVISNVVDRRMGVRDAVVAPRTLWGGHDPVQVQIEIAAPQTDTDADGLLSMGFPDVHRLYFPPEAIPLARFGAVNAVAYDPQTGRFTGVGDARRNGYAAGPRVGPTGPPSR